MSNFSDFIGGSGGGGLPVNIALTVSQTWVPPVDGTICIHVIGSGGGAAGYNDTRYGGGGGGYCKKNSLAVTTSGSFTVVIGAGGNGGSQSGSAGGTSSVAGTGLSSTLTANGGGAGGTSAPTGGVCTGGDYNYQGQVGTQYGGGGVMVHGTNPAAGPSLAGGGGDCDSVGDVSLSGHGLLIGGRGGDLSSGASNHGEFLAGGGLNQKSDSTYFVVGGKGGVGAGGGPSQNSTYYRAYGGMGGNGIVVIQYLPA